MSGGANESEPAEDAPRVAALPPLGPLGRHQALALVVAQCGPGESAALRHLANGERALCQLIDAFLLT